MIDFDPLELQRLPHQGHCNENFLLEKEGNRYLVRRFRLADRDRVLEYKIQNRAFKRGIAAKALYLDKRSMISFFLEGYHKKKLNKKETRALAIALKKLHRIPFRAKVLSFRSPLVKRFPPTLALCHNDLNSKNVLFSTTAKFIDWEYATVADIYFDLATVCEEFVLDEGYFFRAYAKKIDNKKLLAYKKIYRQVTKEWFMKLEKGLLDFL